MEVKKGYKEVEGYIIPKDWQLSPLGDFLKFKNGLNKEKHYFGTGTPIVNYMDVYKNRGIRESDILGTVTLTFQEIKNYEVKKGDILFTRTSETTEDIGVSSVILDVAPNTVFSGFVLRARPKDNRLEPLFAKYCFSTKNVRKEIISQSTYTTRALTNGRHLSKVKVALPSTLKEQSAIATVLSETDSLITNLEKLIAKKEAVKKGTMQALLTGKKRLPGFSEKWKYKTLGEIGECIIGLTYTPSDVSDSGLLVLRSSNIKNSNITFDDNVYVNVDVPEKLITKKGDILICVRNGSRNLIGKCAIINTQAANQTFGAFMSVFRSAFNDFIFHVFQSNIIKKQIDENIGATINQITNKNLNSFKIPFPDKDEQDAITEVLNDLNKETVQLGEKLAKYKQLKTGLMNQLLTGKIRLV